VIEEDKWPITEASMSTRSLDESTDRLFVGTEPKGEEEEVYDGLVDFLETDTTNDNRGRYTYTAEL
jgi:hypothetical protein